MAKNRTFKQRFETKELEGGCSKVKFCSNLEDSFSDEEISSLLISAEENFNQLPYFRLHGEEVKFCFKIIIEWNGLVYICRYKSKGKPRQWRHISTIDNSKRNSAVWTLNNILTTGSNRWKRQFSNGKANAAKRRRASYQKNPVLFYLICLLYYSRV